MSQQPARSFPDPRRQVERARASLGEALGQTQDIRQESLDTGGVSAALAGAVKALYRAEEQGPSDARFVLEAMDHLRGTLAALQDVPGGDPALETATGTVARTLAILFPVSRALPAPPAHGGREDAIPLTQASARDRPLPLTHRPSARPAPPPDDDRRQSPRRRVEVEIGFQSETNFFTGFSMDISSGGLFVATYDVPEVGTRVNVNFGLPSGPLMSIDGTVRWVREFNPAAPETTPGMGVQFERLDPADERAINEYIDKHQTMFYDEG